MESITNKKTLTAEMNAKTGFLILLHTKTHLNIKDRHYFRINDWKIEWGGEGREKWKEGEWREYSE